MKREVRSYKTKRNPTFSMLVLIASIVIGIAAAGLILAPYVTVQYTAAQPSIEKDSNLKVESMVKWAVLTYQYGFSR